MPGLDSVGMPNVETKFDKVVMRTASSVTPLDAVITKPGVVLPNEPMN